VCGGAEAKTAKTPAIASFRPQLVVADLRVFAFVMY
jgi:hypothetical protein